MSRTALVTGGSGGIGTACVNTLAAEHDVAFQYYSNETAAAQLEADHDGGETDVVAVQANVTDQDDVDAMIDTVHDSLGSIDILVTTAGIMYGEGVLEQSPDDIARMVSINLVGSILPTRAVLPDMIDGDGGHIVTVSSTAGAHGSHGDPVYGATKGGQDSFTRSLASVYTKAEIFVNAVAPGAVDTDMFPDDWVEGVERGYPLGRLVDPEEVAETVAFLTETSSISGEVIEIDQGKLL